MKHNEPSQRINFLELLITLARAKWFIFKVVLSVTIVALIISLLLPATYKSTSIVMPVKQQSSLGVLGGLADNILPLSFDSETMGAESLAIILNSRSVRVDLIETFDLMETYSHNYIEQTLRKLDSNTDIVLVRDGGFGFNPITAMEISYTDQDPSKAQAITAFYVSHLDSVANVLNEANTRARFEVIKQRFEQNEAELEQAELAFKQFQEEYGILDIETQSQVLIQSLADAVAQRTQLDIEINLLRSRVESNNPELRSLQRARGELERVIRELTEKGEEGTISEFRGVPSLQEAPDLGLRYMRLYRDVIVQSKIYETIFPQFVQQQMLVEAPRRNIQIVDAAFLPTYKDGPKRAFVVLGGFFFSLFICLFIVLFRSYLESLKQDSHEDYDRYTELKHHLVFWKK
ncbi:MAG: hypothetical protein LAT84_01915 [Balneolia bacterium]|nr:hypothetical protein [Balneolia bacterium]